MITQQTVFVFGAGVSMPYGFPSGKALVSHIYSAATMKPLHGLEGGEGPNLNDIGVMLQEEFGKDEVLKFGEELYLSQQISIDAFLEHRPEFMKIGKTAIALCIARKEKLDSLLSMEVREKGCYQYLSQKMNTSWATFVENKVSFITFNYDRSLEQYLFTSLKHSYGKSDEECAALINQIPIVHVHGSLGPLPWQSSERGIPYDNKYVPYAPHPNQKMVFSGLYRERMRDSIIVISESQDRSPEFERAIELLAQPAMIFFLGFGYHPTNIRRLRMAQILKSTGVQAQGSAMGMEDAEIFSAQNLFGDHKLNLPDNASDSLLFLRKYAKLN